VRRLVLAVLLAVSSPACATADRPEGVVERWLTSLNQGEAGRPHRYADDEATQLVAPEWYTNDPAWIDEIDVGTPTAGPGGASLVPFRIVPLDGDPVAGVATVRTRTLEDGSIRPLVSEVAIQDAPIPEGGWGVGVGTGPWLAALGIGLVVAALAVAIVGAVDRAARPAASVRPRAGG